jgi:flagellar hook assembly protein FlgD
LYKGIYLGAWNGTGSTGQKVTNGTYYIKIDSTDPTGVTTSVTKSINVLIVQSTLQITIYNEAGEVVLSYNTQQIENMVAGGILQASDFNLGLLELSSSVIAPSYSNPTAPDSYLLITLGSGGAVRWDGRDSSGAIVTSGKYFIEIQTVVPGGGTQEVVREITVINHGQSAHSGVILAPNPVSLRLNSQAVFTLNGLSPEVASSQVKIYTIAGELVTTISNDPSGPGTITWNFNGSLASSAYICVVEMRSAAGGIIDRQILKAVLVH